ncbi:lipoprotein bor [Photobacterium aquimaris]|uniref:Lipoprotein bor n=1 Tax=Photobacterium aquimaris TaxID=512643 RepID=A0A2T3IQZ0_9GAMM|nr:MULTISPECIES: Bor family protein [Photobacterium]OBU16856.1 lipoprotein bor [Photobacterium aquimaris]OBU21795.1 lipoprotein bor [Photobacterium aquimaris]PSU30769.1 lipoprotein bor [Photobacterium aquimaris]PSW00052.1 lipoprotein bor [Photobacterium aquimaris]
MKKIIFAALMATTVMTGCAQQTFMMSSTPEAKTAELNKSQPFFVSGIGQHKTVDAAKLCGGADKVAKVEVQQTFVNGLLGVVTFGIYTPRQARVFCN